MFSTLPGWRHVAWLFAVALAGLSALFAIPLWLRAGPYLPLWAKVLFISCAVGACVLPVAFHRTSHRLTALIVSTGMLAVCAAGLFFSLFLYFPALLAMAVAARAEFVSAQ